MNVPDLSTSIPFRQPAGPLAADDRIDQLHSTSMLAAAGRTLLEVGDPLNQTATATPAKPADHPFGLGVPTGEVEFTPWRSKETRSSRRRELSRLGSYANIDGIY
jgi:hypothetical protein